MKKEMNHLITGASLFIKASIACFFMCIVLVFAYFMVTASGDYAWISYSCFGPFALVFGIFFLIMILWMLQEIKSWVDGNLNK